SRLMHCRDGTKAPSLRSLFETLSSLAVSFRAVLILGATMNRRRFFASVLFSLASFAATAAGKVETTGACTNTEVADAIRATLQPQGFRVVGDSGVLCDVWMRKTIPQKSGASDASYGSLANGTLVGVITYAGKGGDYRGQTIKPGTYTLRFQTIPTDGNHLGVAPSPEFFLLAPAGADKDPAQVSTEDLIKLSKQASGTNHPHPLNLAQPTGAGTPSFRQVGDGAHWALEAKTKAQPAGGSEVDFPFAVVLVGKAEG